LIDEEYAGNTVKVLISHLKNYLEEKRTKFKQEEWKVLYNSTNKYIDETDQVEAPSFSRDFDTKKEKT
jgi:predicted SprT family Zn-dependent metalloprotease